MDDLLPPITASDDEVDYAQSSDDDVAMAQPKGRKRGAQASSSALPGAHAASKVFGSVAKAKKAAKVASMFDDLIGTAEPSAKRMKKDQAIDVSH